MITDNAALRRFEWMENGKIVFANYRREGDVFTLPHVEADPALRGTGAAARLMEGIAALAREQAGASFRHAATPRLVPAASAGRGCVGVIVPSQRAAWHSQLRPSAAIVNGRSGGI